MAIQLPNEIKTVYISNPGDASVGLDSMHTQISESPLIDLTVFADNQREQVLREFRDKLTEAFALVWDTPITVLFDFEVHLD